MQQIQLSIKIHKNGKLEIRKNISAGGAGQLIGKQRVRIGENSVTLKHPQWKNQ